MPFLSVIVPSIRVGGLDLLCSGLKNQFFKDFELIISDSIYKYRHEAIEEKLSKYSFPIKHVEPLNNRFPVNSYSHVVNTGIAHASGEVCVITCDHTWFDPQALTLHADFHKTHGNAALMGIYKHAVWPQVHKWFPHRYGPWGDMALDMVNDRERSDKIILETCDMWMANYAHDLSEGLLKDFMWSVLEKEFTTRDNMCAGSKDEPCQYFPDGPTAPQNCDLKNESIPTRCLLDLNGLDEDFDGSHGWQDSEVAERLAKIGITWYAQPSNIVYKLNSHFILNARRMTDVMSYNEKIFYAKRAAGYPPVNLHNNLRSIRERNLVKP